MLKGLKKRKLDIDRSLEELINRSKKARKASKKKAAPTAKKKSAGVNRGGTKSQTSVVKEAKSTRRVSQGRKVGIVRGRSDNARRQSGSKSKIRGGLRERVGLLSTRNNAGRIRARGSGRYSVRGRNWRFRGGRKGPSGGRIRLGTPKMNKKRVEKFFQPKRARKNERGNITVKEAIRARPPALPNGLQLLSTSHTDDLLVSALDSLTARVRATSHSKPMFFRVNNDEYEAPAELQVDDLEYQITLENDEYSCTHPAPLETNGRQPEGRTKRLKVEKPTGLFAHIEDTDSD